MTKEPSSLEHNKYSTVVLFLTFSALVANPKKTTFTVANPARGLLNRGKKKCLERPLLPPPPRAASSEKIKIKNHATHPHV